MVGVWGLINGFNNLWSIRFTSSLDSTTQICSQSVPCLSLQRTPTPSSCSRALTPCLLLPGR